MTDGMMSSVVSNDCTVAWFEIINFLYVEGQRSSGQVTISKEKLPR